ncbi:MULTISPECIES: hypothetical protein [unclassified Kitasatospora]|uniref:hypothetical protein n=1 Tax=unclassified Kitasatospora TaxID=2633591 RepID=UPI000708C73D|nr:MULTISPECIES: hypothetical protein [unclassified Kitasatospora]KQV20018.1 hypothetical protein ASC99_21685 [Kitasatospora sp. Root107]KRB71250.1 hypothetical protein ASE03_24875 [Kitasatospora sp. Root187]
MLRVLTGTAGAALIGFGIFGLLTDPQISDPLGVLWWAIGGLLIHDGLWLPLVLLAGAVLARGRAVHGWALRGGLLVAAALTAVGLPAVLRAGQDHGNPSVLALPYLRNWLLLLAGTAAVTLLVWLLTRRRRPS